MVPELLQLVVVDTRVWYEQKPKWQGTGFLDFFHLTEQNHLEIEVGSFQQVEV